MELIFKDLSERILDCAFKVHRQLGPGLLESAYEECLFFELINQNFKIEKQKPMPLVYMNHRLDIGYRLDLFVENKVIIEIKSVDALNPIHTAQLLTYLKLANCRLGFLINFNVRFLKDGIRRLAH